MDDREKIRLNFWYGVLKTTIDKILIGAIVGLVIFFGYQLLEKYKSNLIRARFLLECRLDALKDLRNKYSKLTTNYYFMTYASDSDRSAMINEYVSNLKNFHASANGSCLLSSEKFEERIQYHFWLHQAVAEDQVKVNQDHLDFGHFIFDDFDELTREALWEQTLGQAQPKKSIYQFVKIENVGDFFRTNYDNWSKQQKSLERK